MESRAILSDVKVARLLQAQLEQIATVLAKPYTAVSEEPNDNFFEVANRLVDCMIAVGRAIEAKEPSALDAHARYRFYQRVNEPKSAKSAFLQDLGNNYCVHSEDLAYQVAEFLKYNSSTVSEGEILALIKALTTSEPRGL